MTGSEYLKAAESSPDGARRALFDEYYNYVYTIVRSRLAALSREDCEECVSDVFAQVFFLLDGEGRYGGELKGIISTVAKRRATDRFRKASRQPEVISLDDADFEWSTGENIEEDAEKELRQQAILDCIERLGEPDSTIVLQRYYYGSTSKQIAQALGMKPSAVRMRCARALKRLKNALNDIV